MNETRNKPVQVFYFKIEILSTVFLKVKSSNPAIKFVYANDMRLSRSANLNFGITVLG